MSNNRDSLGDRMKQYEDISRIHLPNRMPVVIRIDGKAFHTFTRGFKKPFDGMLMQCMWDTTKELCKNIAGVKLAYTQSDEISLLLTNDDTWETQPWFKNNIQKIVSVAASMATLAFNRYWEDAVSEHENWFDSWSMFESGRSTKEECEEVERIMNAYERAVRMGALFDARVFVLPKDEVCNYFIWREQDAIRNSVQMVGHANFSHNSLTGMNCEAIKEKLKREKNIDWNELPLSHQRGVCVFKKQVEVKTEHDFATGDETTVTRGRWWVDTRIPLFWENRWYVDTYLNLPLGMPSAI